MSRGHGSIQSFIVEHLDRRDDACPVVALAYLYASRNHVPNTPHLRSSFRRAARRLAEDGEITLWELLLPTRVYEGGELAAYRWMPVVAPADTELTADRLAAARTAMFLLSPTTQEGTTS
jgi:hypothetical protein